MVRAFVIDITGKDLRTARVVFDRYGVNSGVFAGGRSDEQARNHAVSAALTAVIDRHGPDWTVSYHVTDVD